MTESIGTRLKKIRLEKGISLEDVGRKTKINLNILNAIEEDRIINLSPVYIKGFLKIYCNFLGVEAKDYIPDYKEVKKVVIASSGVSEKKITHLDKPIAKQLSAPSIDWGKARAIFFIALACALLLFILFTVVKNVSLRHKNVSKNRQADQVSGHLNRAAGKDAAGQQKTVSLGIIRLSIRARDDCWIQLRSDGKIVFQNILKKGRSESWQAKDRVEIALGNAAGVDLEVNGKIISSLGKKGQLIKNMVITKDGLIIKR